MEIGYLLGRKYSLRKIAEALGRSVSTISDERSRNRVNGVYSPAKAHHKAYVRRLYARYQGKKIVHHRELRERVDEMLYDDLSPEAVAKRITKREQRFPSISKDSIYRYIKSVDGRRVATHRWLKKRRRGRKRGTSKSLSERTFIDQRPKRINARTRIGDCEADFIVSGKSGKGILLVVVDRKSRTVFLEQIISVKVENVHRAFLRIKARFPEMQTITTDNDLLFQKHKELERVLEVKIYFCHPYHSWEKGTVENINGVIRRDIPKGSDISRYAKKCIMNLEAKLNRRPLKCLKYYMPQEIMQKFGARARNKKHLI